VRSMPAQPGAAILVNGEPHPGAPTETLDVTGDRLDDDVAHDARHPSELLTNDLRLEPPLFVEGEVLPVAPAAASGAGPRTWRLDPRRRGLDDLDRIGPQIRPSLFGHLDPHALTGGGVPDEHNTTVRGVADADAAVRHPLDVEQH
jgi:hypothetical protein